MSLDPVAALTAEQRQRVLGIAAAEQADSGRLPLGEGARATLAGQGLQIVRAWLWHDPDLQGFACVTTDGAGGVHEFTADPARPGAAHALLAALMGQVPTGALWAHGDRAQARIAAALAGLPVTRELLLMSRALVPAPVVPPVPPQVTIRPFDPGQDVEGWLRVNAAAFAQLPDQAGVDRAELEQKLASNWHRPAGFLVAVRAAEIVGFHWTKIEPGATSGEVYALGIMPDQRGTGLAAALLGAGLAHLAAAGMTFTHLFVEAGNIPAVALYRRAGFEVVDTDRQYVW